MLRLTPHCSYTSTRLLRLYRARAKKTFGFFRPRPPCMDATIAGYSLNPSSKPAESSWSACKLLHFPIQAVVMDAGWLCLDPVFRSFSSSREGLSSASLAFLHAGSEVSCLREVLRRRRWRGEGSGPEEAKCVLAAKYDISAGCKGVGAHSNTEVSHRAAEETFSSVRGHSLLSRRIGCLATGTGGELECRTVHTGAGYAVPAHFGQK